MATFRPDSSAPSAPSPNAPDIDYEIYRFTDPDWVRSWVGSLYLLPPDEQATVLYRLIASIHLPPVQAVLLERLRQLGFDLDDPSDSEAPDPQTQPIEGELPAPPEVDHAAGFGVIRRHIVNRLLESEGPASKRPFSIQESLIGVASRHSKALFLLAFVLALGLAAKLGIVADV